MMITTIKNLVRSQSVIDSLVPFVNTYLNFELVKKMIRQLVITENFVRISKQSIN
jgi:hypothetical protein